MEFAKEANFLHMHIFIYSKRKGTPAASFTGQIPPEAKKRRNRALTALVEERRQAILSAAVADGRPIPVLFEGKDGAYYSGHADNFLSVLAEGEGDPRGHIRTVVPLGILNGCVFGKIKNDI